jgi:hypothetical protein
MNWQKRDKATGEVELVDTIIMEFPKMPSKMLYGVPEP